MSDTATSEFVTHSPEETIELGRQIASRLKPPTLVLLLGDLGAGKTTLTKGLVEGLQIARQEEVTSPTFTLIHEYGGRKAAARLYHIDLYRIEDAADLMTLGLEDMLAEKAIIVIEWGERLGPALRSAYPGSKTVEIQIEPIAGEGRRFELRGI